MLTLEQRKCILAGEPAEQSRAKFATDKSTRLENTIPYSAASRGFCLGHRRNSRFSPAGVGQDIGSVPASTCGIVQGADGYLYGVTNYYNAGFIYRTTTSGSVTTLFTFSGTNGGSAQGLMTPTTDGNLYGVTSGGGAANGGTVFRFTPPGNLTSLSSFTGTNGISPTTGMILCSDGNLYGVTSAGGNGNSGAIFMTSTTGVLTLLYSFTGPDGKSPVGMLAQGYDGNIYGVTSSGGANGYGTVYKLTPPFVAAPVGGIVNYQIAATGSPTSYGATALPPGLTISSTSGLITGTLSSTGTTYAIITASNAAGTGSNSLPIIGLPRAPAITSTNSFAATDGFPFIFQVTAANNPTSFTATGLPSGLFMNYLTGQITGTSTQAGTYTATVVAASPSGSATSSLVLTLLAPPAPVITSGTLVSGTIGFPLGYQITATNYPTTFGASGLPPGLTVNTSTGLISGTLTGSGTYNAPISAANAGGTANGQVTFVIAQQVPVITLSQLTSLVSFTSTNGASPWAGLIQGTDGNYYGAACTGGASNLGGVFQATPGGVLTLLASFSGTNSSNPGTYPEAGLIQASDGNFYGTTSQGGSTNQGTVFRVTPPYVAVSLGASASYQIAALNTPSTFGATGLPNGLFVNLGTGLISGTPTATGTTYATISASNTAGTGTAVLPIYVFPPPPAITSSTAVSGTYGAAFSYQALATNNPTAYRATGLPGGLGINAATGLVSGTPITVGTASATVIASNAGGSGSATVVFSIAPPPPPSITGVLSATGTNGSAFSYQITASNSPTNYGATGLPSGLGVNAGTGLISGTPTTTGTFNVTISASNAGGTGSAILTVTVQPTIWYSWSNLAGRWGGAGNANGIGSAAQFGYPSGIALDGSGNLYVADSGVHNIRKVTLGGVVTTVAGTAWTSGSADGTGVGALFKSPCGVATDTIGNVYVADTGNFTIRKIAPGGVVTTVAGSAGAFGSADGTGSAARFGTQYSGPNGLTLDGSGNVYVADTGNYTIRKVTPAGVVTTQAGAAGAYGNANGTGTAARFAYPRGITADAIGNLYVVEAYNAIRKVTPAGVVTTLAGGNYGSGDGTGNVAQFNSPYGLGLDAAGNIFVADTYNHAIRRVTAGGIVTTMAGSAGSAGSTNGAGVVARFSNLGAIAVDPTGTVLIADAGNNAICKLPPGGATLTLAGGGYGSADGTGSAAQFKSPYGLALDGIGNVYLADTYNHTIRKVTPGGVVTTLAGTPGVTGTADGTGSNARFNTPFGIAVDGSGTVYVAGSYNYSIRKVTPGGVVTTLAGCPGNSGSTDGTGTNARFSPLMGVAVDGSGTVFVADTYNCSIRKVTPGGTVTTMVGGNFGSADGIGSQAGFKYPNSLTVDGNGNLYVADSGNSTVRVVTPAGVVTTIGGMAGSSGANDGVGTSGVFNFPWGIAVDGSRNVYVADQHENRIIKGIPGTSWPIAASGEATAVSQTTAVINGSVTPNGVAATAFFEYGIDRGLVGSTMTVGIPVGSGTIAVATNAALGALAVATTYYYRADAVTTSATVTGPVVSFTTQPPSPPTITSAPTATGTTGQSFSYEIVATSSPTSFNASGLPGGLAVNTANGLISGTPTTSGTFTILLSASNAVGSSSMNWTLVLRTVYGAWQASIFGTSALDPAVAGDLIVNNPAGISNLMAYGLLMNPFTASAGGLPTASLAPFSGTGYLSLQFLRNAADRTLTYSVEATNDLTHPDGWAPLATFNGVVWSGSGNVYESGTGQVIQVQVKDSQPVGVSPKRFFHLKVSH